MSQTPSTCHPPQQRHHRPPVPENTKTTTTTGKTPSPKSSHRKPCKIFPPFTPTSIVSPHHHHHTNTSCHQSHHSSKIGTRTPVSPTPPPTSFCLFASPPSHQHTNPTTIQKSCAWWCQNPRSTTI